MRLSIENLMIRTKLRPDATLCGSLTSASVRSNIYKIHTVGFVRTIFALVVVLTSSPFLSTAAAYVDPGAGSQFIQAILAGIPGLLLLIRSFWNRKRNRLPSETTEDNSKNPDISIADRKL